MPCSAYKKNLPQKGNLIIHLDSHPDLLIPTKNNWILSEACEGFFSTLVWIQPPWSTHLEDGSYTMTVGKDETGKICVCSNFPVHVSTCTYKSMNKLINPKEINLEVVTLGKFVLNDKENDMDDFIVKLKEKFTENSHYFLSVDLDFFSTQNPFENMYEKINLYDQLIELYWFGVSENWGPDEIEENVMTRMKQLNDLENLWKHVAENGVKIEPLKTDLWKDMKVIAGALLSEYSEIDWELIHMAGCTWNDKGEPLSQHLSSREDITKLIDIILNGLISALPQRPAAVTIRMDSIYCPLEDKDFIYQELIKTLKSKFGIKINEHFL